MTIDWPGNCCPQLTHQLVMKKAILLISNLLLVQTAFSQTYTLDKNHSRLGFSAVHFGISNVEGTFRIIGATLKSTKDDLTDAVIEVKADAASVNTDNDMRDKDLRGPDWFDVSKYPTIEFKSTSFRKLSDGKYRLEGTLTMRGVTKPVVFDVSYNGKAMNPMLKKNIVGFTITGNVDRTDFGIGTDAFSSVVGKKIEVRSNAEFIIGDEGKSK
jgi:polyisoprenoid-binding protein YceI